MIFSHSQGKIINQNIRISTMIWGEPGIGISSIVTQTAQENNLNFFDDISNFVHLEVAKNHQASS